MHSSTTCNITENYILRSKINSPSHEMTVPLTNVFLTGKRRLVVINSKRPAFPLRNHYKCQSRASKKPMLVTLVYIPSNKRRPQSLIFFFIFAIIVICLNRNKESPGEAAWRVVKLYEIPEFTCAANHDSMSV